MWLFEWSIIVLHTIIYIIMCVVQRQRKTNDERLEPAPLGAPLCCLMVCVTTTLLAQTRVRV